MGRDSLEQGRNSYEGAAWLAHRRPPLSAPGLVQIEVKRSTGIPRSFMVTVDGPDHKGALLTSTGEFAVPLIDQ